MHNLTREQIAERFGLSLRTVDRMVARRRIPHIRIGRLVRFNLEEVAAYFERQGRVLSKEVA